jgi:hypothetical protein
MMALSHEGVRKIIEISVQVRGISTKRNTKNLLKNITIRVKWIVTAAVTRFVLLNWEKTAFGQARPKCFKRAVEMYGRV